MPAAIRAKRQAGDTTGAVADFMAAMRQ